MPDNKQKEWMRPRYSRFLRKFYDFLCAETVGGAREIRIRYQEGGKPDLSVDGRPVTVFGRWRSFIKCLRRLKKRAEKSKSGTVKIMCCDEQKWWSIRFEGDATHLLSKWFKKIDHLQKAVIVSRLVVAGLLFFALVSFGGAVTVKVLWLALALGFLALGGFAGFVWAQCFPGRLRRLLYQLGLV